MTVQAAERLLAGLMPPHDGHRASHIEPLPLATAPSEPPTDSTIRYALGCIDDSGKVPAAHLLESLAWEAGDRLNVSVRRGVVVLQRDPEGLVAVTRRRALVIPAAARRVSGIRSADSLLLAAVVGLNTVVVHPPLIIDKMMTLYHQSHDDV